MLKTRTLDKNVDSSSGRLSLLAKSIDESCAAGLLGLLQVQTVVHQ